jgi:short-subunit dehydrogenase
MVEVNVAALTRLTVLLLPGVLERRRGAILNVASTAVFQPGPNQAVYAATKAYVLSFTEALAEEVRSSGVRVCCLARGATDTGFAAQAGMQGTRLFHPGVMDASRVSRAGHDGLRRGKTLVVPGLRNRILAFSVRLSPRVRVTKIAAYLQAQVPVRRVRADDQLIRFWRGFRGLARIPRSVLPARGRIRAGTRSAS